MSLMSLTEEQRVAHLLRRFGFGATPQEMAVYAPLGVKGALDKLLNFGDPKEEIHPFRFFVNDNGEEASLDSGRVRGFWFYQFLTTQSPLREKLALFWHDHFAVDGDNAGDALMLMEYVQTLRRLAKAPFPVLLEAMARCPSFMEMLTMQESTRAKPNENFARELLELYTLGEGNYTEKDIKEAARCFTGWTYVNRFYSFKARNEVKLEMFVRSGQPFCSYGFLPSFYDSGEKTILGKTKPYTGEQLMREISASQRCAEFVCGKLWTYFSGLEPTPAVSKALAAEYLKTNGSVEAIVRAIAARPEFWEPAAIRTRVKSPIEYCVHIARSFGSAEVLPGLANPSQPYTAPLAKEVWDAAGGIAYNAGQAGQDLLYPPSVAGWDWGPAWINSNSMLWRMKFGGFLSWEPKDKERKQWGMGRGGRYLLEYVRARQPQSLDALAGAFLRFFDCALGPEAYEAIKKKLESSGGLQPIQSGNDGWAYGQLWNAYELLRGAPEFQVS